MYTYTNPTTWLITILLVAGFSFVAGALASNRKISYSIRICFIIGLSFLSFLSFVVLHKTTESSIKEVVEDVKQKTISYYENGELLTNRFKPTNGWYQVTEVPVTTPLFLKSGDPTKYVVLTIHTDCAGFLKMAFPTNNWMLPLPEIEEKHLGEKWTSVNSSYSGIKAVRIEKYEVKEFALESRVVEARF